MAKGGTHPLALLETQTQLYPHRPNDIPSRVIRFKDLSLLIRTSSLQGSRSCEVNRLGVDHPLRLGGGHRITKAICSEGRRLCQGINF